MPGFLLRYIKKITHEADINRDMVDLEGKKNEAFCSAVIEKFNITVHSKGLENIPKEGGCLFVCNHPLGGMDAMAIVHEVYSLRPDLKFIVNDVLLNIDNVKEMFQGVNKHGKTAKESLKQVRELFASDQAIFIFPAGLVSRKRKGVISDPEWKKTFISQAKRNKLPIIPVYIEGRLSNFFYRLANLRSFLGIKSNIEMMYLADEMYKQRNAVISIVFGKIIQPTTFDSSKNDLFWANWVRERVYQLKNEI